MRQVAPLKDKRTQAAERTEVGMAGGDTDGDVVLGPKNGGNLTLSVDAKLQL